MAHIALKVPVTANAVGSVDHDRANAVNGLMTTLNAAADAAVAIGVGDGATEVNTLDTAAAAVVAATNGTELAALTAAVVASQAIGVGDASAENLTCQAAALAVGALVEYAGVVIIIDTDQVTTTGALHEAFEALLRIVKSQGVLT